MENLDFSEFTPEIPESEAARLENEAIYQGLDTDMPVQLETVELINWLNKL